MTKKLLLATFIFIFLGIKAQTTAIEFPSETLTEKSINKILDDLRKKGVKEFEIQIRNEKLHKIMQKQLAGSFLNNENALRGSVPPQVNSSGCNNPGFENGTSSNWTFEGGDNSCIGCNLPCASCFSSTCTVINEVVNVNSTSTVNSGNCSIPNTTPCTNGVDNYGGFPVVFAGNYSLLLNNTCAGFKMQEAQYTFVVSSANDIFIFDYAAVLQNGGHPANESPYFDVSTTDLNTGAMPPCAQYNAISGNLNGFTQSNTAAANSAGGGVFYKPWTTVSLDLQSAVGHTVTIKFTVSDCNQGGHFGYCYIDAACSNPTSASGVAGLCGTSGGSVTISAPPGFATYQWYGPSPNTSTPISGATSQTLTTTAAINDTFVVKTTSAAGCPSTFNIVIQPASINVVTTSTATCKGGTFGGVGIIPPSSGTFQYAWSGSSGSIGTSTTTSISNLPVGTYSLSIVDNVGHCPQKDTTVTVLAINPTLQTSTAQLCGTQTILHAPTSYTGTPYAWYDNTNTLTAITTQTYNVNNGAAGQHYAVTYLDSASHCVDSLQINLNQTNINFVAQPVNPCQGGNSGSLTFNASSNNSFTIYDWTISGGTTGSGSSATPPFNFPNLAAGTYSIVISAPGNTTCFYTDTVTLHNTGVIPVTTDLNHSVCTDDILVLNSGAPATSTNSWTGTGLTYGVNTASTLTVNTAFTNTVVGFYTYTDTIKNSQGCKSIYTAIIKIKSFTAKMSIVEPILCYNDSTGKLKTFVSNEKNGPISTPDMYTFDWLPTTAFLGANPITVTGANASSVKGGNLKAGTYTCIVTNGNCVETATITLTSPPALHNDSIYAYYCPKDSLALVIADTGNTNYVWHPNNSVASVTGDSAHVPVQYLNKFYVTYKRGGCPDTGKIIISVTTYDAFRPDELVNVFSPNADKKNDFFYPFYSQTLNQYEISKQSDTYELTIYDRWGIQVYSTTEYNKPWDGKTKSGHDADAGSYFFIVKYKSNCASKADEVEKKGFVELMR